MRFCQLAVRAVLGASLVAGAAHVEAQQTETQQTGAQQSGARPASETAPSSAGAPASQNAPAPTFSVHAQLVSLPVVVRNKSGALVTKLNKDDFELAIDGRQQPIRYFDRDNNLPLTLGLLVDISGSVRSALDEERAASEVFLDQMVTSPAGQPPDQAFLLQFAHQVDLLQDLTPSVTRLQTALRKVGDEYRDASQDRSNTGYGHRRGSGAGTTLYDALYLGSTELMQKQQGRKAMVVLTDGEDRGSRETLDKAIAAAQRAETVVYAIYFKGERHGYGGQGHGGFGGRGGGFPGGGGGHGGGDHADGRKVLAQITRETGGRTFEVSGKQTFAAIYTQIGEELRSQYRLGYVPDPGAAAEGFHRVQLSAPKDKKLSIQTREGYYGGQ
jgi:VWFA-related protein